jgi:hypothetical protein
MPFLFENIPVIFLESRGKKEINRLRVEVPTVGKPLVLCHYIKKILNYSEP